MGEKSNRKVFRFLRVCEAIASLACGIFHIIYFNDDQEPNTQEARFMVPFFGIFVLSCFGMFNLAEKYMDSRIEAIGSSVGAFLFFYASIQSMINVENDKHMEILDDRQEFKHMFFKVCRIQSIATLTTALLFMMHASFAIDLSTTDQSDDLSTDSDESENEKPLRLYLFFDDIWLGIKNNRRRSSS